MKPPKCKLCKEHHYSHESHIFSEEVARVPEVLLSEDVGGVEAGASVLSGGSVEVVQDESVPGDDEWSAETGQTARNRRYRRRHREKYNAYMREYNRRRKRDG